MMSQLQIALAVAIVITAAQAQASASTAQCDAPGKCDSQPLAVPEDYCKLHCSAKAQSEEEWIKLNVEVEDLEQRWQDLCRRLGVAEQLAAIWWTKIEQMHSERHRHYHTLQHVAEMMSFIDSPLAASVARHRDSLELASFFHDAVYNVDSTTNEADSAALYREFASDCRLTRDTARVSDWILWTQKHQPPKDAPEEAVLFLDFDMAVLSKPWSQYYEYASQIRREYSSVPEASYLDARPAFFAKQLSDSNHRFYHSESLAHFEERARVNLSRECELLRSGEIPATDLAWIHLDVARAFRCKKKKKVDTK